MEWSEVEVLLGALALLEVEVVENVPTKAPTIAH